MELILWRHADAEDGRDDAARKLTPKGLKQAARMAAWLEARLPHDARIIASPAVRAQQTAQALPRKMKTVNDVRSGASPGELLKAAGWPDAEGVVVLVGHQPAIGAAAALALTGTAADWRVKKGAIWWISARASNEKPAVVAVMSPDLL